MSTEAHDVLEEDLAIGDRRVAAVGTELEAKAAELRRREVEHQRRARRPRALQDRKVGGAQDAALDLADARRAGIEAVVADAGAPPRHELVDRLQVPAVLHGAVVAGRRRARGAEGVEGERAAFAPLEELALQDEVALARVALGRPLVDAVDAPGPGSPAEAVGDREAASVDVVVAAIVGTVAE